MHPTLFQLAGVPIHSYGISIAVGFVAAILLGVRTGRRQGISVERILDLAFWILVSALLGSRVLYVITEIGPYSRLCVGADAAAPRSLGRVLYDCSSPLHLWEGGLVFYGGFLGAVGASLWYTRRHRLGFLRIADLIVPLIALGHCFGRLGCFCAGCCYGKPTSFALGLAFPPQSMIYKEMVESGLLQAGALATPRVHPTQLYEALGELLIALTLWLLTPRKRYHGQLLLGYLFLYPSLRFLLELLRADPGRHFVVALATPRLNSWLGLAPGSPSLLSTSQLISLLLLATAGLLLHRLRRREAGGQ